MLCVCMVALLCLHSWFQRRLETACALAKNQTVLGHVLFWSALDAKNLGWVVYHAQSYYLPLVPRSQPLYDMANRQLGSPGFNLISLRHQVQWASISLAICTAVVFCFANCMAIIDEAESGVHHFLSKLLDHAGVFSTLIWLFAR